MSRFFSQLSVIPAQQIAPVAINMQGDEDNQFQAIAIAIIDLILTNKKISSSLAKKLLLAYRELFQLKPQTALMSSSEYFAELVKDSNELPDFIDPLAQTLRQMMVKVLKQNPEIFNKLLTELSIEQLQDPTFTLPTEILDTLVKELNLSIVTKEITEQDSIPARSSYSSQETSACQITLQIQNGRYFPQVINTAKFKNLGSIAFMAKPSSKVELQPDVIAIANLKRKEERKTYKEHVKKLTDLLAQNEITKEQLIELHIQSIGHNENVGPAGTKNSRQSYFQQPNSSTPIASNLGNYEQQVEKILIEGVAQALTLGYLPVEVYENLEQLRYHTRLGG